MKTVIKTLICIALAWFWIFANASQSTPDTPEQARAKLIERYTTQEFFSLTAMHKWIYVCNTIGDDHKVYLDPRDPKRSTDECRNASIASDAESKDALKTRAEIIPP